VLYNTLIAPVARANILKGAGRIIMVPHGVLAYLPFQALVDPTTRRYLSQDHALFRLPTSASLPVLRDDGAMSNASATGLDAVVFAPLPDSLPGTRREAVAIREFRARVRTHIGPTATESALRTALSQPALVHVASHASMNGRNPLFSHVRLAPNGRKAGNVHDDGRLDVHEVLGLRIASPLVFLSGCETGRGQSWATTFDTGEDYTTIAQTFLYAGARNVIATLWRVDDAASAEFAGRFYRALDAGDVVDALAQAQRAMQNDARFRDPYYWAAYDIMGAGTLQGSLPRKNVAVVR
jgi:CHAT domain-containing protein